MENGESGTDIIAVSRRRAFSCTFAAGGFRFFDRAEAAIKASVVARTPVLRVRMNSDFTMMKLYLDKSVYPSTTTGDN